MVAIAVAGFLTLPRYFERQAHTRYKAAIKDRAEQLKRWTGLLETGSCWRRDDGAKWLPALGKLAEDSKTDALRDVTSHDPFVDGHCVTLLTPLETDPDLSDTAQGVVREWLAVDRSLSKAADKPPDQQTTLLEKRDRVRTRVRSELIPAVRAQIRKVQDEHAAKHDYAWWQIELGLQLEDILDHAIEAHQHGHDIMPVIGAPLRKLIDQMRDADREVGVRVMSSLDVLAHSSGDAAWAAFKNVEDNGAWSRIEDDNSVLGPMPPEPQGCDVSL